MKRLILALFFLPCVCFLSCVCMAVDREQLNVMLTAAATTQGKAYLEARDPIVKLGQDAKPLLVQAATDASLTWQQRLVARICYERMTRAADIEALRRYDWRTHPQYDKQWEMCIVGPGVRLGTIVVPKCTETGLWYYYIEMAWRDTGEYAVWPFDPRINDTRTLSESWLGWCMSAVQGQPESYYLTQALNERLELDASLSEPISVNYYWYLLLNKETNAVPILVKRYDAYSKHELQGPEAFPGRHDQLYKGMFGPVLALANTRHADLIEKFIAGKPVLAPLEEKLATVRSRPAPPPSIEPPFRLGQQLAKP